MGKELKLNYILKETFLLLRFRGHAICPEVFYNFIRQPEEFHTQFPSLPIASSSSGCLNRFCPFLFTNHKGREQRFRYWPHFLGGCIIGRSGPIRCDSAIWGGSRQLLMVNYLLNRPFMNWSALLPYALASWTLQICLRKCLVECFTFRAGSHNIERWDL